MGVSPSLLLFRTPAPRSPTFFVTAAAFAPQLYGYHQENLSASRQVPVHGPDRHHPADREYDLLSGTMTAIISVAGVLIFSA